MSLKHVMLAVFFGLVLWLTPAIAKNSIPTQASSQELKIDFPEVEGWKKGLPETYPSPALGYSVAYNSKEGGAVTIYVYNGGLKTIPTGVAGESVKAQFNQAKSDLYELEKLGRYQNVKEVNSDTVALGGIDGKTKALHALFNFSVQGNNVNSEIYLFGYKNNFIKIRSSRSKAIDKPDNPALKKLFAELDSLFTN